MTTYFMYVLMAVIVCPFFESAYIYIVDTTQSEKVFADSYQLNVKVLCSPPLKDIQHYAPILLQKP